MKKNLTDDQWKKVEENLWFLWVPVRLRIDGHEIVLQLQRVKMKLHIMVFIDGEIKATGLSEGTDLQRRFLCPRKKYIHSAKYRKSMKRISKRRRDLYHQGWNDVFVYYWPWWNSFSALKRHLIENNESIELSQEEQSHE